MLTTAKIKLLVVDDSAVARTMITDSLAGNPDIEVVGTAVDPYMAREKILSLNPDVMTLDIEMPRMDGLTFLKLIMRHRPMPVVVLSSSTSEGSAKAMEALRSGAVDVVGKPEGPFTATESETLAHKIKAAAVARMHTATSTGTRPGSRSAEGHTDVPTGHASAEPMNPRALIVIGASTGGTEALKDVLSTMPGDLPPVCVVQHIPAQFSSAFANRLDGLCQMEVREAKSGDELKAGLALIAPGGKHLLVRWTGEHYVAQLNEGPAVHHQRPAVDVLFDSVVKAGGARSCAAALLTGMGRDGADGLLRLKQHGAHTIAQSEASCVVFGMPREAIKIGAATDVLDLADIAAELTRQGRRLATSSEVAA
jgi:two-component system, chemotaxis family, protein-glutamate methylesterase/glutaminase